MRGIHLKGIHFSEEEAMLIKRVKNDLGLTYSELAKLWGLKSSPSAQTKIEGTRGVSKDEAMSLYNALNKDPRLQFLENLTPPDSREKHWIALYDAYVKRAEEIYVRADLPTRGAILGELEQLIERIERYGLPGTN